jgi:hypothetical protein
MHETTQVENLLDFQLSVDKQGSQEYDSQHFSTVPTLHKMQIHLLCIFWKVKLGSPYTNMNIRSH